MTHKRNLIIGMLASLISIVILPSNAVAHHGITGQFDLEQVLRVKGAVNRVRFVNPHAYVYFKVKNDQGDEEQWRCELRSGSLLKRKGWSVDMFAIGSTIEIFGSPDRRDPKTVYTETITFEDGTVVARYQALDDSGNVILGERELKREDGTPNLAGNWSEPVRDGPPPRDPTPRSEGPPPELSLTIDGSPQRIEILPPVGIQGVPGIGSGRPRPPLYAPTEIGHAEASKYSGEDNPRFNCEPTNILFDYAFDQMMNKIEQTGSTIVITYGFMDLLRTIHLIGDFPENIEPNVAGYSVGKWEGDTLVVHTKGFKPGFLQAPRGARAGVRHGNQMVITERFNMSEDGMELKREYTVVDPVYLAEPYSGSNSSLYTTEKFIPYECEELKDETQ